MVYIGSPLNKKEGNNNYGSAESPLACQTLCHSTPGYKWFNWNGDCWLKTERGEQKEKPGSATGPSICAGRQGEGPEKKIYQILDICPKKVYPTYLVH